MNYQGPELVKSVAEWAGLEANICDGLPVSEHKWVEAGNQKFHHRPFKPWDERAQRYQLNHLIKAMEEAGYRKNLLIKILRLSGNLHYCNTNKSMYEIPTQVLIELLSSSPDKIWQAICDTLIENGEIQWDE